MAGRRRPDGETDDRDDRKAILRALREELARPNPDRREATPAEQEAAREASEKVRRSVEGASGPIRRLELSRVSVELPRAAEPAPLGPFEVVIVEPAAAKRKAHRPPDQLDVKVVRACERELRRRTKAGKPKTGPLTLEAIATRIGWPRSRVTQAEELLELDWPLLRTHPDFSTDEGFVRWPTTRDAALLLRLR